MFHRSLFHRSRSCFTWGMILLVPALLLSTGCEGEAEVTTPTTPDAAAVSDTDAGEAQLAADAQPGEAAAGDAQRPAVQTSREGDTLREVVMYPTGQRDSSILMLEKTGPAEVRSGQPYEYQIRVTNLTGSPLAGVKVAQALPAALSIDSAQPAVTEMQKVRPSTQPSAQQASATTKPSQQQQQGQQQQEQQQQPMNVARWTIGELGAGESQVIQVRAFAGEVGSFASCITADYEPTLCTVMKVVQPQLAVSKRGPERIDICEPLTYTYTVANQGTGVAKGVRIEDPLPEGLTTEDGQQQVAIDVGDLPAGENKEVAVNLKASGPGEFASRAVARSASDEAHSNQVATTIVQPNLAVEVSAPQQQYLNQQFAYEVTVTNNGEAPAEEAVLQLNVPDRAEWVRGAEFQQAEGEAQLAASTEGDAGEQISLGTLPAGESKTLRLTFVGREAGEAKIAATANAECAKAAVASAVTQIAAVPALQVWVVDAQDPVQVGGQTSYVVRVKNEGSGPAKNVSLTGTLPRGMKFESADGITEVKADGNNLTFAPLQTLAAGDEVEWTLQATAEKPGTVQFQVQLKSQTMSQPVAAGEPTTLLQ